MRGTVEMSAFALRQMLGENFDYDKYEEGRRDCRNLARKVTHTELEEKLEEVKAVLRNGDFRKRYEPSYWIGCLCEFDFVVWPPKGGDC